MHLDRTSRRILGSLVEKKLTTPEQYPLTMNALVLACNQKSNRDPAMQIQEFIVEGCLKQLRVDGWITVVGRDFGRAIRYSERLAEQIGLSVRELAILTELMLRGPQTEQELQRRCERMTRMGTVEETLSLLGEMASRRLVFHLPREVGQRVARWKHLMTPPEEEAASPAPAAAQDSDTGDAEDAVGADDGTAPAHQVASPAPLDATPRQVEELTRQVEEMRAEIEEMRIRLDLLEGR